MFQGKVGRIVLREGDYNVYRTKRQPNKYYLAVQRYSIVMEEWETSGKKMAFSLAFSFFTFSLASSGSHLDWRSVECRDGVTLNRIRSRQIIMQWRWDVDGMMMMMIVMMWWCCRNNDKEGQDVRRTLCSCFVVPMSATTTTTTFGEIRLPLACLPLLARASFFKFLQMSKKFKLMSQCRMQVIWWLDSIPTWKVPKIGTPTYRFLLYAENGDVNSCRCSQIRRGWGLKESKCSRERSIMGLLAWLAGYVVMLFVVLLSMSVSLPRYIMTLTTRY